MRSDIVKLGDARAPHRSLLRATGLRDDDFHKPFIAICNSHVDIIPGHVHLDKVGQFVKQCVREAGGMPFIFNTIGVDDGIAMGHEGMKFSLPSRELIADSVETMLRAHCFDGMICIPNCDKIVPGMLMGAMRCNIPTIFVSGGPMEAGKTPDGKTVDLIDVFNAAAAKQDGKLSAEELLAIEQAGCPTCGSCSGMFTANSMNCLCEALGMALPTNGTLLATSAERKKLFRRAAKRIVEMVLELEKKGEGHGLLPREIVTHDSIDNSMILDMAMGGSTNTVLHILAIAREAGIEYDIERINALSRRTPNICKVAPSSKYHVQDVHNAGGIHTILGAVDRGRPGLLKLDCPTVTGKTLGQNIAAYDIRAENGHATRRWNWPPSPPAAARTSEGMTVARQRQVDPRPDAGRPRLRSGRLHPRGRQRLQPGGRAGDPLRQPRPEGRGRQGRRRPARNAQTLRPGRHLRGRNRGLRGHRQRQGQGRRRGRDPLRRAPRRTGHAGDARPHHRHQGHEAGRHGGADHRRPLLRRHGRRLHRTHQPRGRRRRPDRPARSPATSSTSTSPATR